MKNKFTVQAIAISALCIALINTGLAQTNGKYGNTPEDSIKCVENLSLYVEFYKQKSYKDALAGWRWVFNNCPQSSKKMYADGADMYDFFIKQAKDVNKKEKLIDTLLLIYDRRIEYFDQEGYVLGLKGVDILQYRKDRFEDAYSTLQKSVDKEGNQSKAGALTAYFQASALMLDKSKIDKEKVIEIFDKVSGIIDYQLSKLTEESKRKYYLIAKENVEMLFEPIANCEDLIKIYKARFEEDSENAEWLKRATNLMAKKQCTDADIFVKMSEKLHKLEPSAESAYLMGIMMIDKNQNTRAADFLKEAVELQKDHDKKSEYYLKLAEHFYKNLNQPDQARTYAFKAAAEKPGWGKPYIAIGDMYAASAKECGTNDFEVNAVYWTAVDKYSKAKSVDNSMAEEANKKIATWSKYFPNQKDAFFYGYNNGQPYNVGCWINETTTVRVML